MNDTDLKNMERAITEADRCAPLEARIPKVGAVIAIGGTVIGSGHRGTGGPDDDDHAEKNALKTVPDRSQLPQATIYTTLEPCTPGVRSDPLTCCTELIRQAEIKKVFIGILDPNQDVRGKGLWELQERGIDVELFPPDLAKRIRVMNETFIRTQRRLGIRFDLPPGSTIRTYDKGGVFEFTGKYLNQPDDDVMAITRVGNRWWPQPHPFLIADEGKKWSTKVHFGTYGPIAVYVVRANELGLVLAEYYRKVAQTNEERIAKLKGKLKAEGAEEKKLINSLPGSWQSIEMDKLPKGLELQAKIEVDVERPPSAPNG